MKFHKKITDEDWPVYSSRMARKIYVKDRRKHRLLSIRKQENIRFALKHKSFSLASILIDVGNHCGYCFKYECNNCPLKLCRSNPKYNVESKQMNNAKTKAAFALAHEAWCKKLGLWQKGWT